MGLGQADADRCGFLVFASGALALYTGVWPTSWSTGWQSLYLFEAVAVIAFGVAWFEAGLKGAKTRTHSESDHIPEPEKVG
jgi:hypothetical protein